MAASRMAWYSRSVRVWAGATVMESPVCTPMGSRFSMEQMITTLSWKSRITSSSNSFQPTTDSSSMTSVIMLAARPSAARSLQIFQVVGDAAAGAPQGEAGAHDDGVADLRGGGHGLIQGADDDAVRHPEIDVGHGVPEEFPVFGLFDDLGIGPDHLDAVFLQDAGFGHGNGAVEAGLAPESGEQGIGALAFDHLAHHFRRDGLDIRAVGHFRVGHDGGRVGIDQDHLVAFFSQGFAGLGAGIIKLAGLTDDDGA